MDEGQKYMEEPLVNQNGTQVVPPYKTTGNTQGKQLPPHLYYNSSLLVYVGMPLCLFIMKYLEIHGRYD